MKGFDVLDKNQTILGNLLIEASAGTGKTFTIEHTVLRLIQEEKIPLHKILLLTFTFLFFLFVLKTKKLPFSHIFFPFRIIFYVFFY
jgi:hypothetical protein